MKAEAAKAMAVRRYMTFNGWAVKAMAAATVEAVKAKALKAKAVNA